MIGKCNYKKPNLDLEIIEKSYIGGQDIKLLIDLANKINH